MAWSCTAWHCMATAWIRSHRSSKTATSLCLVVERSPWLLTASTHDVLAHLGTRVDICLSVPGALPAHMPIQIPSVVQQSQLDNTRPWEGHGCGRSQGGPRYCNSGVLVEVGHTYSVPPCRSQYLHACCNKSLPTQWPAGLHGCGDGQLASCRCCNTRAVKSCLQTAEECRASGCVKQVTGWREITLGHLWTNPRRTFVVLAACKPRSPKFAGGGLDHRALIAATSGVPAPSALTTVLDTEVRVARCEPAPSKQTGALRPQLPSC